jgi:hypothetical protein
MMLTGGIELADGKKRPLGGLEMPATLGATAGAEATGWLLTAASAAPDHADM